MINLCACLGPMYGEPLCYCRMEQHVMDSNPIRQAADEASAKAWSKLFEPGGYFDSLENEKL